MSGASEAEQEGAQGRAQGALRRPTSSQPWRPGPGLSLLLFFQTERLCLVSPEATEVQLTRDHESLVPCNAPLLRSAAGALNWALRPWG